jgi:hypothetical protein
MTITRLSKFNLHQSTSDSIDKANVSFSKKEGDLEKHIQQKLFSLF